MEIGYELLNCDGTDIEAIAQEYDKGCEANHRNAEPLHRRADPLGQRIDCRQR